MKNIKIEHKIISLLNILSIVRLAIRIRIKDNGKVQLPFFVPDTINLILFLEKVSKFITLLFRK